VEPGWWRLTAIIFPLVVFTIVAMVHLSISGQINQLESERDKLNAEVAALQPYIQKQRELVARKAELEKIINVDREIKARFIPWSDNLARFINQIPRRGGRFEVFLRSVNTRLVPQENRANIAEQGLYDRKPVAVEFNLQGEARNETALARFVKAFEDNPNFGINFQQGSLNENGGYDFTATVAITESGAKPEGGERSAR
jgi:type IV pilus assembly protein PilN